jgi:hypothetical protein
MRNIILAAAAAFALIVGTAPSFASNSTTQTGGASGNAAGGFKGQGVAIGPSNSGNHIVRPCAEVLCR